LPFTSCRLEIPTAENGTRSLRPKLYAFWEYDAEGIVFLPERAVFFVELDDLSVVEDAALKVSLTER
jgi:hypothetical protein